MPIATAAIGSSSSMAAKAPFAGPVKVSNRPDIQWREATPLLRVPLLVRSKGAEVGASSPGAVVPDPAIRMPSQR